MFSLDANFSRVLQPWIDYAGMVHKNDPKELGLTKTPIWTGELLQFQQSIGGKMFLG